MWHRKPHARADDAMMQPLRTMQQIIDQQDELAARFEAFGADDGCTPDHCTQADVPMIARTHTPRTCPALATP